MDTGNPHSELVAPRRVARDRLLMESLDALSANYIHAKAEATGQTPVQVIGALVREKVAAIAAEA